MDPIEFYYKIPKECRGKVIELPKHSELKSFKNHNKKINVPKNAYYLILMQIGIVGPTIMYLDKEGLPVYGGFEKFPFGINALEKRIGLIFKKVDDVPY